MSFYRILLFSEKLTSRSGARLFAVAAPRLAGVDEQGFVVGKNDFARFGAGRLLDVSYRNVVDRDILRALRFAVERREHGCLDDSGLTGLAPARPQDDVRAGDVFRVQPVIAARRYFQREHVVLTIVSADEHGEAVGRLILARGCLELGRPLPRGGLLPRLD